jgi:class 3 adenylate cyclase
MGEGVLASFNDVEAAVKTALDLMPRPGAAPSRQPLRLRVGIHRGTTLAATLNDQLDYFGTTARQAVATLQHARAGELVLTQPVAADPAVASLLNARHIEGELIPANLAGHTHLIRVQIERFPLPNPRESFVSSSL